MWYSCFATPDEVRIYRIIEQDETIGYLPMLLQRRRGIRYLTNLINSHCLHGDPLIMDDKKGVFCRSIAHSLFSDTSSWDVLIHRFNYSFSDIPELFSDNGFLENYKIKHMRKIEPTYSILLDKSSDAYFHNDMSSGARKSLRLSLNRLSRAGIVTFHCYMNAEAMEHWPTFLALENSGWKGKGHTSIKSLPSNFRKYYELMFGLLASKGVLHLYVLELNARPIASGFGYVEGSTFHWAKAGYDEQFRDFSPSNLLLFRIIEHLISEYPSLERLHMFPWDYGYKHRFTNEKATYTDTVIYSNTIRGKTSYGLSLLKHWIREKNPEILTHTKRILNRFR